MFSVASVLHGHQGQGEVSHAMVLDIFDPENETFIFKNTYDQDGQTKQFKVKRTDKNAPEELYFVHIEVKNMENLPDQRKRKAMKQAELKKRRKTFSKKSCSWFCFR